MPEISFDLIFDQLFGFVSDQFGYFLNMLRNVKFLGISVLWFLIILGIIGVILSMIFRKVSDSGFFDDDYTSDIETDFGDDLDGSETLETASYNPKANYETSDTWW